MNYRNRITEAQKIAATSFQNVGKEDLADDVEAIAGVTPRGQHYTPQQVAEYERKQDKAAEQFPPEVGTAWLKHLESMREPDLPVVQQDRMPEPEPPDNRAPRIKPGIRTEAPEPADDDDTPNTQMRAQFTELSAAQQFLFAGRAIITVVSKLTGTRFTFRFSKPKQDAGDPRVPPTFVSVLTGSDNNTCYSFIGSIFANDPATIRPSRKSAVGADAPSAKAASWFLRMLARGDVLEYCEVWHEGRCGRCGRRLTVPSSIASGFGPECINHV